MANKKKTTERIQAQRQSARTPQQQALRDEAYGSVRAAFAAGKPKRRVWDLVLSIVLLLGLGWLCLQISYLGALLAVFPAQCDTQNITCDFDQINIGVVLGLIVPSVITLVATAVTIIRYLLGRVVFWIPIVGLVLVAVIGAVAVQVVVAAIPGSSVF
ncbi:hypothetical protein HQQ81_00185 [Microbacteriaceae bacterium VKM Ac-2854]|nr:hypothetical protein [Microbacteriaceae bacterium VKM Ac-2854]